ncbi:hypothetical protein HMSSN139_56250 [Paenibacillus sp. HMSSN-139]|nr:hypothetical protein HMSSN139_56250 [Paenibacillus sp. HMSSN-139]
MINPKLPYCTYPFKGLAGVGVAYKLAQALLGEDIPEAWTELAALGTIADLMPLTGENRVIVKAGLVSMAQSAFPGMTALLGTSGWSSGEVTSTAVAFGLAPRINASGRMSHANRAVALLTSDSMEEAEAIAEELDVLNKERQMLVEDMVQEALQQLEVQVEAEGLPDVIVVAGEGWNAGVVGIVASKLLERYYRPTIVLGIHPETGGMQGLGPLDSRLRHLRSVNGLCRSAGSFRRASIGGRNVSRPGAAGGIRPAAQCICCWPAESGAFRAGPADGFGLLLEGRHPASHRAAPASGPRSAWPTPARDCFSET